MVEEVKINFFEFFKIVWREKWWIMLVTAIFSCLGLLYAFNAREEFQTYGKILPELQGKSNGGMGQFAGLASLAGVDLSSLSGSGVVDAVRPDLYPDVISSTPFFLELFKSEVQTKDNKKMTFEQYYHAVIEEGKKQEDKLLQKYPIKEDGIIVVNRLSEKRLKNVRSRISAVIDKKSGIITISSKMPDPVVAATVARFAMQYLMEYVTAYRTEKLRADVDYLADQVSSSRGKFYSTQERRARYSDQFQDMALQSADVKRERIDAEYKLSSSFYNELLKKFEEAKFKLQRETPVFKVLEPPVVPVRKSEPRRGIIVVFFFVFGGIFGIVVAMLRKSNFKKVFIPSIL